MMINKTRTKGCSVCRVVKPLAEFYIRGGRPSPECKVCHRKKVKERYDYMHGKLKPVRYPLDDALDALDPALGRRSNDQLRKEIRALLDLKGLRQPQYVARRLGISTELAAQLMSEV